MRFAIAAALFATSTIAATSPTETRPAPGHSPSMKEARSTSANGVRGYQGWFARWRIEGSCVGGPYPGYNPDLMDIYLLDDSDVEHRMGETEHGTAAGCASHTADYVFNSTWNQNCQYFSCTMLYNGFVQPPLGEQPVAFDRSQPVPLMLRDANEYFRTRGLRQGDRILSSLPAQTI